MRSVIGTTLLGLGYLSSLLFGLWAFILDLAVLRSVGGLPLFVAGFFLAPFTLIAAPLYSGLVVGDWQPLRVMVAGMMMMVFAMVGLGVMGQDREKTQIRTTGSRLGWFFGRTIALPVKVLLFAWLIYNVVGAAVGALLKVFAAATVTMAVLGLFATVVVFPILMGLIAGAVVVYALPLVFVPRLWHTPRARVASIALTAAVVVGSGLGGDLLNKAAVAGIAWVADREPCAALRAGVTGSATPSEEACRFRQ